MMMQYNNENVQQNEITMKCVEIIVFFADQTVRFPKMSSKSSKYILVIYDADISAILAESIKSRVEQELLRVTTNMYEYLTARDLKVSFQILDNNWSKLMIFFFKRTQSRSNSSPQIYIKIM